MIKKLVVATLFVTLIGITLSSPMAIAEEGPATAKYQYVDRTVWVQQEGTTLPGLPEYTAVWITVPWMTANLNGQIDETAHYCFETLDYVRPPYEINYEVWTSQVRITEDTHIWRPISPNHYWSNELSTTTYESSSDQTLHVHVWNGNSFE
jgi:hypothetical protein